MLGLTIRVTPLCLMLAIGLAYGAAMAKAPSPSPRMLVEVTDLSGVAVSPDGTAVAFRKERASIERNAYRSEWHVAEVNGARPPLRIGNGGEPLRTPAGVAVPEQPQWSPDSRWIYYRALHGGEIQVWRAARDGRIAEQVTRDSANVEWFLLSADGARLYYRIGATRLAIEAAEQAEYDAGILFDDGVHGGQNIFRSLPLEGRLASHRFSEEGTRPLLSTAPRSYRVVELDSLTVHDAAEAELSRERRTDDSLRRHALDTRMAARSSNGRNTAVLAGRYPHSELLVFRNGARPVVCEACRAMTIEGVAWSGGDEVVFTARDVSKGFAHSLYAWRPGDDAPRLIVASDGLLAGDRTGQGSTCAVGDTFAFCVTASALSPPRLERIELDTGAREVIADPNSALAVAGAAQVEAVARSWTDADGRHFSGHLLLPRNRPNGRMPLFINYYRCPGYLRGGYGDEYPLAPLASAGIASLCVNMTPATEHAEDDYNAALSAVEAIISELDEEGVIDRRRVGMGGLSFGSEVALWIAGESDLLSAVSISSAQPSPTGWWLRASMAGRRASMLRRWGISAPDETPDQWRRISPSYFAEGISAPVLMQLPEGEFRTNVELYARLRGAGIATELYVFPNEPHQKVEPRHKLAVYDRNLDWFRFWLQGFIDRDPKKSEQFARWTSLRSAIPAQADRD